MTVCAEASVSTVKVTLLPTLAVAPAVAVAVVPVTDAVPAGLQVGPGEARGGGLQRRERRC